MSTCASRCRRWCVPRAAGVAFTLDPTNGDRSVICIDGAWGFGEAVVSGEVTPDNFLVDKVHVVDQPAHDQPQDPTRTGSSTAPTAASAVDGRAARDQGDAPCLTDDEILAVARLARAAEKHYGCPQDIEWAVDADLPDGENVVLLQARPETVWSKK